MKDRVVVQAITRQEYADTRLHAEIFRAQLVELCDGFARIVGLAEFQIRFGKEIEILRTVRMLLDLLGEFGQVELRALFWRKTGPVIEIVEKMLVGIRARRRVLRKRLENAQISLRSFKLFEIALDHREFVIARRGIAANFDISAQEVRGFSVAFGGDAEVRQFEERFGKIGIGAKSFLKVVFRPCLIALAAFDEAQIEKTRRVVGIEFEAFRKIFASFIEPSEMAIGESHERVGTRGWIEIDQKLEFVDGFIRLAGHEIAFAESGTEIGSLGSDFYAGFEKRDGIFKIVLRHADASEKKNNVGIFRGDFVRADEELQGIDSASLIGINLRKEIENFRGIGLQILCAFQNEFRLGVFGSAKINLAEIEKDFKCVGLEGVGFFQFELGDTVLLFCSEEYSEREM